MDFDVDAMVKSAIPQMIENMKDSLAKKINAHAENVAVSACGEAVKKWVQEQMIPEIIAQLETNKQKMIDQSKAVADVIGEGLAEALKAKIAESLKSSYNVSDIVQKLLKGY